MDGQMSSPSHLVQQRAFDAYLNPLKAAIFGKQNERLEYLMDSYFKLSAEMRTGVIAGLFFTCFLTFLGVIVLYISALNSLQKNLDNAFQMANTLRDTSLSYLANKQKFKELEEKLTNAGHGGSMVSVLESKTKSLNLTTAGFPPQVPVTDFPSSHPLAEKFQSAKVEFRVSNISLKKIMDLVIAVESTDNMFKVSSLKIKGLYQNKLYFDVVLEVEGAVSKSK